MVRHQSRNPAPRPSDTSQEVVRDLKQAGIGTLPGWALLFPHTYNTFVNANHVNVYCEHDTSSSQALKFKPSSFSRAVPPRPAVWLKRRRGFQGKSQP